MTAAKTTGTGGIAVTGIAVTGIAVTGLVLATVGHVADLWWLVLFGALSIGTAAGSGIAIWVETREQRAA